MRAEPRRLDAAAEATWRASSSARRTTSSSAASTASTATLVGIFLLAGRQRARRREDGARPRWPSSRTRFPEGLDLLGAVRHDALRRGVDPRGGEDARRGDAARVPRRLPVPAELARDDHSVRRRAGVADRHVRRHLRCSATRSTRSRCSAWCWRSASSSTTRSSCWRTSSASCARSTSRARDAAIKAMREVTGPIIAIVLTLTRGVRADRVPRRPRPASCTASSR